MTPPRRAKTASNLNTPKTAPKRSTLGVKRGRAGNSKEGEGAGVPDTTSDSEDEESTSVQSNVSMNLRGRVLGVLLKSKRDEQDVIAKYGNGGFIAEDVVITDEEDDEDEDDVASHGGGDLHNFSQNTMDGKRDYTKHPNDVFEDLEGDGDVGGDGDKSVADSQDLEELDDDDDVDISKLRVVTKDVSIFEDNTKSFDDWWIEDPTREETLCDLWREERSLYVMRATGHRIPSNKTGILKKFAMVLEMPRELSTLHYAISFCMHYCRVHTTEIRYAVA